METISFLQYFTISLTDYVTTNLVIYKSCLITLGLNKTTCLLLGTGKDEASNEAEVLVQPYANLVLITLFAIESTISALFCIFIGSWSNERGRRPVLLIGLGSFSVFYVTMLIVSHIESLSPWFIMLRIIPFLLFGGTTSMYSIMLSYTADITTESKRAARINWLYIIQCVGLLLGSLSSSFVLESYGYEVVYIIATILIVVAFLYTCFAIPESIKFEKEKKSNDKTSWLKDYHQLISKDNKNRGILIALVLTTIIFFACESGAEHLQFLFFRSKFQWSLTNYTIHHAVSTVVFMFGSLVCTYVLHNFFAINEIVIILIGLGSLLFYFVFIGLATSSLQLYLAILTTFMCGSVEPMTDSLLSKVVTSVNVSRAFAIANALQILITSAVTTPFLTYIYNITITTCPELYNFAIAGFVVIGMILMSITLYSQKNNSQSEDNKIKEIGQKC